MIQILDLQFKRKCLKKKYLKKHNSNLSNIYLKTQKINGTKTKHKIVVLLPTVQVLGVCNLGHQKHNGVLLVTELGQDVSLIKLLQMSWEDRLRVRCNFH